MFSEEQEALLTGHLKTMAKSDMDMVDKRQ